MLNEQQEVNSSIQNCANVQSKVQKYGGSKRLTIFRKIKKIKSIQEKENPTKDTIKFPDKLATQQQKKKEKLSIFCCILRFKNGKNKK